MTVDVHRQVTSAKVPSSFSCATDDHDQSKRYPGRYRRCPTPDADFTDAYSVHVAEPLDALQAARRMVGRRPRWVNGLLMLRNLAVTPFGLKRGAPIGAERIGIFPVVSVSPERVVMGLNDAHLDFRVVVEVAPEGSGRQVTATTFVHTRNRLGRLNLAAVKPFHRVIVPALLAQVGRA